MQFNGDGDDVTVNGLNGYDMTMKYVLHHLNYHHSFRLGAHMTFI